MEEIIGLSPDRERFANKKIGNLYEQLKKRIRELDRYHAEFNKTFYALSLPNCWLAFEPDADKPAGGACVSLDPNNLAIYLSYGFGTDKAQEHLKDWLLQINPWARKVHNIDVGSTDLNTYSPEELGIILLPSLAELRFEVTLSTLAKEITPQVEEEVIEQLTFIVGRLLKEIPDQGFKLHVSGTKQSAALIFQLVKPLLDRFGISYKVVRTEDSLDALAQNHQKGKLITIYPRNDIEAVKIAHHLDQIFLYAIERGLLNSSSFDSISTDRPLGQSGGVFYRYGILKKLLPLDDNMYEETGEGGFRFRLNDNQYSDSSWPSNEPDWNKWDGITPKTQVPTDSKNKTVDHLQQVYSQAYDLLVEQLLKSHINDMATTSVQEVSMEELFEEGIKVYFRNYLLNQSRIIKSVIKEIKTKYNEISKATFGQENHKFSPFQKIIDPFETMNLTTFWAAWLRIGSQKLELDSEKNKVVCQKGFKIQTDALDTVVHALSMSTAPVEKELRALLKTSHFLILKGPSGKILLCLPFERVGEEKVIIRPRRGDINKYGDKIRQFFLRELIDQIEIEEIEISVIQRALEVAYRTPISLKF